MPRNCLDNCALSFMILVIIAIVLYMNWFLKLFQPLRLEGIALDNLFSNTSKRINFSYLPRDARRLELSCLGLSGNFLFWSHHKLLHSWTFPWMFIFLAKSLHFRWTVGLYSWDLSPNYFSGTIPSEIVDMGSILYLNLSNIPLTGRFPLDISFIKGLKT